MDGTTIKLLAVELLREFLPNVDDIKEITPDQARRFFDEYMLNKDAHVAVMARFHESSVPLPDLPFDLEIAEGGTAQAWLQYSNGQVSLPHPILLGGFTTAFGLFGLDRITAEDGVVTVRTCCVPIEKDITKEVLESPLKPLFTGEKIGPVLIDKMLDFDPLANSGGTGPDIGKIMEKALHEAAVKLTLYHTSGAMHSHEAPFASIQVFVNLPVLKETYEKGVFSRFDFTGVLDGSYADWKEFPLSYLPKPTGIRFGDDATAHFTATYDPDKKLTRLKFSDISTEVYIEERFGKDNPMRIAGTIEASIQSGGKTTVSFKGLEIVLPFFPDQYVNVGSFKSTLNGSVNLHMDEFGDLQLDTAEITVSNMTYLSPPGVGLGIGTSSIALAAELAGKGFVKYNAHAPNEKVQLKWKGGGDIQTSGGTDLYVLEHFRTEANLFGNIIDGFLFPNLNKSYLDIRANNYGDSDNGAILEKPFFTIKQDPAQQNSGSISQYAVLNAGAARLNSFGASVTPSLVLNLESRSMLDEFRISGTGGMGVSSVSPEVNLGSKIYFSTDGTEFNWLLHAEQDQILGALVASGVLKIGTGITKHAGDKPGPITDFEIRTPQPYVVIKDPNAKYPKTIAKEIRIDGDSNERRTRFTISGTAPGKGRLRALVHRSVRSGYTSGNYLLQGLPISVGDGTEVSGLMAEGRFGMTPGRPYVALRDGRISAALTGKLQGPVVAQYEGTLGVDTKTGVINFRLKDGGIDVGPIQNEDGTLAVEMHAQPQGTMTASMQDGRVLIGGRQIGFHSGEVYVRIGGQDGVNADWRQEPVLDVSLVADRFRGVRRSTAYSGGDGMRFYAECHPEALNRLGISTGDFSLPVDASFDRLPLSIDAYWRVFQSWLRKGRSR